MHLDWIKNTQNNDWFDLLKLNLDSPYFNNNLFGIYAIWYTAPSGGKMIRIGLGIINEKLKTEKVNPEILKFSQLGQIKVTWALTNNNNLISGILAYLQDRYNPILGEFVPSGTPKIQVNLIGQ